MRKIRLFFFIIFTMIAVVPFVIGTLFLSKKQIKKLSELFEDIQEAIQETSSEPNTIEDDMLFSNTQLTQEFYRRGTNKNLSVECRLCGTTTPRGKYYCRKNPLDNGVNYAFICRECFHSLPVDENERIRKYLNIGE